MKGQIDLFDRSDAIRSRDRVRDLGEVFTPPAIVEAMLDILPKEVWTDPTKKFLEPACGDGAFLVAILVRLMKSLRPHFPDPAARHRHIIEHMIYAVDIMPDNVADSIERLGAGNFKHNIVVGDFLASTPEKLFCGAAKEHRS